MATEYALGPDDTHESLAKDLLEQAEHPGQVTWSPRPDVHGGGVYVLADEGIAQRVREVRYARRAEDARKQEAAEAFAKTRDESPDVAEGLATPAEAGFPASIGGDPGAAGTETAPAETVEDEGPADEEPADDNSTTPEDESRQTPAQKRAAKREAAKKAEAEAAAAEKTE